MDITRKLNELALRSYCNDCRVVNFRISQNRWYNDSVDKHFIPFQYVFEF